MKRMSKLCPSGSAAGTGLGRRRQPAASPRARHFPRIFRNSYTRAGRHFFTSGWVVKLQHQGRRRTLSLRSAAKAAARMEAKAICDTLLAQGWEAVLRDYSNPRKAEACYPRSDLRYWRDRLLVRRYRFPASGGADNDLAARVEHAGIGYWFPLGTSDPGRAAAQARRIYETAVKRGWEECCRRFPRELIIGFEWSSNPLLWTYATIHTIMEHRTDLSRANAATRLHPVLIVEQDAGIRRALAWSINQQGGCRSITCGSPESFSDVFGAQPPHLVLLNRNVAERLGFRSPGQVARIRGEVPALTYSVAVDGDQLFVSTPGGAEGYFIKRVKPDRLLAPILNARGQLELPGGDLLPRVKSYFKELLLPRPNRMAAGAGRLTPREIDVLALLSRGCVDKEIAQALGISAWTVHGHIKSIFERLQVRTRTEAVVRYLEK